MASALKFLNFVIIFYCSSSCMCAMGLISDLKPAIGPDCNENERQGRQTQEMIIISTDGGADDASALILMLEQPDLNILAITCTYGNVYLDQACDNTRRTLELMGRADEIPVYPGCDKPIIGENTFDGYYGYDGFGNNSQEFPLPAEDVRSTHAANVIVAYANYYPGQITIVALGPLTDLAVALKLDPNLPSYLKRLFIMGGTSRAMGNISPVAEFNFHCDPTAANAVISEFYCPITITPYELCIEYTASWEWYDQWISSNTSIAFFINETFAVANEKSRGSNTTYGNCDLQAATILAYPEIVEGSTSNYAEVETCGSLTFGQLVVDYRPDSDNIPNVVLYTALNQELMLEKWSLIVNDSYIQ